jgi:hypothetical protein
MATILRLIRVALNLSKALPEQILAFGNTVLKGLTGNVNFPTPPVDLPTFKAALDAFATYIVDAKDGSKRAITQRNKQGAEVLRTIRALATYVELNCKEDMAVFLSSGFQPKSTSRNPAQLPDQPTIDELEQGVSGQFLAWVKWVRSAKSYNVRVGAVGPGGATPTSWTTVTIPHAKRPALLNGLTPGTTYAVQVQAYGTVGYTEWSDSMVRMVI